MLQQGSPSWCGLDGCRKHFHILVGCTGGGEGACCAKGNDSPTRPQPQRQIVPLAHDGTPREAQSQEGGPGCTHRPRTAVASDRRHDARRTSTRRRHDGAFTASACPRNNDVTMSADRL